ncbi:MAG TPA: 2-oxoacid:acceptor oxidoreductase subunit alpha [Thermoplasmata archaeon]|nr:2-oxoacid:acceptor oxidoreductase subunit alpha [Thermoplasmata archaeon]
MPDDSFSWVVGGPQGSGVDSAASIMGRACALGGLWVIGRREYHSNIMGLHSYFQVRTSGRPIRSPVDRIDLLVAFDEETLFRHSDAVAPGGGIVYDSARTAKALDQVPSFHGYAAEEVRERLEHQHLEPTIAGLLQEAVARGVALYPYPYQEALARFGKAHPDVPQARIARAANTTAVAASLALLSYDTDRLEQAIRSVFSAKPQVADLNVEVARFAYADTKERFRDHGSRTLRARTPHGRLFLTGTQAVALGKMLGGCRFQTYYPITPASDESEYLEAHEVFPLRTAAASAEGHGSVLVVQTEDEIAALTMAAGAALAGARAATSTSGPGFSLMTEGLGFAGINEIPVVVTLYQRAGPSTGLPTRHEQGDLRFALHAGHGEYPRIIVASGDVEECLYDAVRCLNYAARYQLPVIHLVDKALASTQCIAPIPDLARLRVDTGRLASGQVNGGEYAAYLRFALTEDGVSPRAPIGTPGTISWHTGDEHDERGHIDEDPENRRRMMEKRAQKLDLAARDIPEAEKWAYFGPPGAPMVVVSWGSTKGAILDALEALSDDGKRVGFLQLRLLHPFPSDDVTRLLGHAERRVVVEANFSAQLAGLIAERTRLSVDSAIVKFNGRQISVDELEPALRKALKPGGPARVVLTGGR